MAQLIPFLDSLALIQGIIIGVLIMIFGKFRTTPILFGLFVITYSVELWDSILTTWDYHKEYPVVIFLPFNFYFLNLPLLYLYLESIVGKLVWKKHFWWLLPGLLEIAFFSIIALSPINSATGNSFMGYYFLITMIFYLVMSLFIIYKVIKYQRLILDNHSNIERRSLNWVKYICIYFCIYMSLFAYEEFVDSEILYAILSAINVVFIYVIGILGLRQKYADIPTETEETLTDTEEQESDGIDRDQKVADGNELIERFKQIDQRIREEGYFQNSDLSLINLARILSIPTRTLSKAINSGAEMNFNKYINKLRAEYATTLLKDPKYDHLSMSGIASEAGFHSRSTFYASFKSNFGVNPTEYKAKR